MKSNKRKSLALLVSLLLILSVTVGGTLAFLLTRSGPVENTFIPSTVTTSVVEKFDGNVKSNVKIANTGDTAAYIRAAVIITWQKKDVVDGKEVYTVHGQMPVACTVDHSNDTEGNVTDCNGDYCIKYNTSEQTDPDGQWILAADGFYYWTMPVAADSATESLIVKCEPVADKAPAGYYLCVEILGSGIQSQPTTVVTTEWSNEKITITVGDDGNLTINPKSN